MTKEEFRKKLTDAVESYIENFDRYDSNPQLRVNPLNLDVELIDGRILAEVIEDSDEAVENAAIAEGAATEDAADYQVKQNPSLYAVKALLATRSDGKVVPDEKRINAIVAEYFDK